MSVVKCTLSIVPALGVLTIAGCAMTSGNLTDSAERLERSAYYLKEDASSSYSGDAREFAEETRNFRDVVEDRDADDEDVRDAFRELSENYHDLRDEIDRADSSEAQHDFQPVTEAYLDVEREVRRESGDYDSDRYAGGEDHDRDHSY